MISTRNGMNGLIQALHEDIDLIKRMISQVFTSHEIAESSQNIKDSKNHGIWSFMFDNFFIYFES